MMMIEAVINDVSNIVENVVVTGTSPWTPPPGYFAVDVTNLDPQPGIGWSYDPATGQFAEPVSSYGSLNMEPSGGPTVL